MIMESMTLKDFNPTGDSRVDDIKKATDSLIDMVKSYANDSDQGKRRAAIAITNYEHAAMWAVKACFS